jgi:hypothetical protein
MPNRKTFDPREKYDHSSHPTTGPEQGDLASAPNLGETGASSEENRRQATLHETSAMPFNLRSDLSVVKGRYERHAPDNVSQQRRLEKAREEISPGRLANRNQERAVDGTRYDVREAAQADDVSDDQDDERSRGLGGRQ